MLSFYSIASRALSALGISFNFFNVDGGSLIGDTANVSKVAINFPTGGTLGGGIAIDDFRADISGGSLGGGITNCTVIYNITGDGGMFIRGSAALFSTGGAPPPRYGDENNWRWGWSNWRWRWQWQWRWR